ncbi:MAG: hypothetical protein ACJ735_14805 [Actinomycetes bacterium]
MVAQKRVRGRTPRDPGSAEPEGEVPVPPVPRRTRVEVRRAADLLERIRRVLAETRRS